MRVPRALPPAAAPLGWRDVCHGAAGIFKSSGKGLGQIEAEFRRELGVRRVFGVSSGTAALVLALRALRARSRREDVVIPAYTCFSVPAAVVASGLRPVLCDVNYSDYGLDVDQLEGLINDSTLAVVAHHLFGIPSSIQRIAEMCQAHDVALVEDVAQAMGVTVDGRWLGTFGVAGIFSFGRGKHLTAGGGGMIVTSSLPLATSLEEDAGRLGTPDRLTSIGRLAKVAAMTALIRPSLYWIPSSLPWLNLGATVYPTTIPLSRMTGVDAGLLQSWRTRLRATHSARLANASDLFGQLQPLPAPPPAWPYLRYPVLTRNDAERERILEMSREEGLGISRGYPSAVDAIPQMRPFHDGRQFPVARDVAARLVTLPTHHLVSERDRTAIQRCFAAASAAIAPEA